MSRSIIARGPELVTVGVIFDRHVIEAVGSAVRVTGHIDVARTVHCQRQAAVLPSAWAIEHSGPSLVSVGIILDRHTGEIAVRTGNAGHV